MSISGSSESEVKKIFELDAEGFGDAGASFDRRGVDKGILRKVSTFEGIRIMTPVAFVMEQENENG